MTRKLAFSAIALMLALAACAPAPTSTRHHTSKSSHTAEADDGDTTDTIADSDGTLGTQNTDQTADPDDESYFGLVTGLDGKPAADVLVRGYLVGNNSGGLISNNGGGLISDKGQSYRLLATGLETHTDADGHFKLADPEGRPLNLEAVADDDVKAIRMNVASDASEVSLVLAKTGSITGRVKTSAGDAVTNLIGVDVFVPGTSYSAKTDADGNFTLSDLPAGTFSLYATKDGLGAALVQNVKVDSEQATTAPELVLSVKVPTITSLSATAGAMGSSLTITGTNFGASEGKTFAVTMGGSALTGLERPDDQTISFVVPTGARTGDVVVSVSGIPSAPVPFTVYETLEIASTLHGLPLGASLPLRLHAVDTEGMADPEATAEWLASGAVSVSASGVVKAVSQGTGSVSARIGLLMAGPFALTVYDAVPVVNTLAGGNANEWVDGVGDEAHFSEPHGLAVGADGQIYVADEWNNRIRVVSPTGVVTTLAGGELGGDADGTGDEASFSGPMDVAVGPTGDVYVADQYNHRIRKVTPAGVVTTLAGSTQGFADGQGDAAQFTYPMGLAVDDDGTIYVADKGNNRIRTITPDGTVSTFAADVTVVDPSGVALDGQGALWVAGADGIHRIAIATETETTPTLSGETGSVFHIAVDTAGNVYAGRPGTFQVLKVTPEGTVSVFAGTGEYGATDGPAASAQFGYPYGLAIAKDGSLLVAEGTDGGVNRIRQILLP